MEIKSKKCNKCNNEKEISEFNKRSDSIDGYRSQCKECLSIYQSEYQPKYYNLNKELITDKKYKYRRTKEYKIRNIEFIKNNKEVVICRNLINSTINRLKISKNNLKNIELLEYTYQDFKYHIENLFIDGMTWENHGEWHIDHIKPISKFEIGTDIKIINALSNLQPLWQKDNLKKSNKETVRTV